MGDCRTVKNECTVLGARSPSGGVTRGTFLSEPPEKGPVLPLQALSIPWLVVSQLQPLILPLHSCNFFIFIFVQIFFL